MGWISSSNLGIASGLATNSLGSVPKLIAKPQTKQNAIALAFKKLKIERMAWLGGAMDWMGKYGREGDRRDRHWRAIVYYTPSLISPLDQYSA
jgi:hypothetical protein